MRNWLIVLAMFIWVVSYLGENIAKNKAMRQVEFCQDSLAQYRNYLSQLRVPASAPVVDSLFIGNMFYNYQAQKIGFYRRALTDADAANLIPQTPECLAAYQWLRGVRGYSPAKAIKLTIRWWEKQ